LSLIRFSVLIFLQPNIVAIEGNLRLQGGTLKLIALAVLLASFSAQAGEVIRLKSTGAFRPAQNKVFSESSASGLMILQWKSQVHESEKALVSSLGAEILQYIPDDAFLARVEDVSKLESLDFLNAIVPYEAGMKVEPVLAANGIFSFEEKALVTIQTQGPISKAFHEIFATKPYSINENLFVAEITKDKIWKLAQLSEVLWVEKYIPFQILNMKLDAAPQESTLTPTGFESGSRVMGAEAAYQKGFTGKGEFVAFADTGLDTGDLNTILPDFRGQVKSGFAVGLGGKSWGDPQNHGTHVAGSIAGAGVSSNGLIRGSGYGAKLIAQGMWSDIMNNIVPPNITKLFDQAYKDGARIHSNSWGAPNSKGRYDSWAALADGFMFNNPDFLAVFAAGNDGSDLNRDGVVDEGTVSSPGSSKNVMTVGASKNYLLEGGIQRQMSELRDGKNKWGIEPLASSKLSDDARGMAAFSSRGPTADGRIKPEVVAPGTNIVSARSKHPNAKPEASWGIYDDNYLYMGGTSMATPLTSGALAVVREAAKRQLGASEVSAALVKALAANTAFDLFPGQFGQRSQGQEQPTRRPNNHQGWGRVDMDKAVSGGLFLLDERTGLATGGSFEKVVRRTGSSPVRITLSYTDAPGAANAAKTLVNDLDLKVIDSAGKEYFPFGRGGKDSTNIMEQIDLLQPEGSEFRVIVSAANVPQGKNGKQPFALVIDGAN